MAAFLSAAWFTIIVAAVPAMYDFYTWVVDRLINAVTTLTRMFNINKWTREIQRSYPVVPGGRINDPFSLPVEMSQTMGQHAPRQQQIARPHDQTMSDNAKCPHYVDKFRRLLGPLSDLQAVTGLSIVIAGFVTHRTISFYHEQLVLSYWTITLNSFWASRAEFMDLEEDTDQEDEAEEHGNTIPGSNPPSEANRDSVKNNKANDSLRVLVRRLAILASCVLGVCFQIWVTMREWEDQSGQCYNYRDGSSNWPWVVGLLIFCPMLSLTLFERTRAWLKWWLKTMRNVKSWFLEAILPRKCKLRAARSRSNISTNPCQNEGTSASTWPRRLAIVVQENFLLLQLFRVFFVLFWLSQVWLSVWAYGDTEYRITWWFYLGFCIWNSFDIISLRQVNIHLLGNEEHQWGFGQVLPLVMLFAIGYNMLDIFLDDSEQASAD